MKYRSEYKLYTLDNQFIMETDDFPIDFTGIVFNTKPDRKRWFLNGKLHNLSGPAVEWGIGPKDWYIDDKRVTKKEHKLLVDIMKLKGLV